MHIAPAAASCTTPREIWLVLSTATETAKRIHLSARSLAPATPQVFSRAAGRPILGAQNHRLRGVRQGSRYRGLGRRQGREGGFMLRVEVHNVVFPERGHFRNSILHHDNMILDENKITMFLP